MSELRAAIERALEELPASDVRRDVEELLAELSEPEVEPEPTVQLWRVLYSQNEYRVALVRAETEAEARERCINAEWEDDEYADTDGPHLVITVDPIDG